MFLEPFSRSGPALAQRGFLHGIYGHPLALGSLQRRFRGIQRRRTLPLLVAQLLQRRECRVELILGRAATVARLLLSYCKFLGLGAGNAALELRALAGQSLALVLQSLQSGVNLLDARLLDLRKSSRFRRLPVEFLPTLLPCRHRGFGHSKRLARSRLLRPRCVEFRVRQREELRELCQLLAVARNQRRGLRVFRLHALEVRALALAQLPRMLQRLLGARCVGTRLVVAALDGRERVRAFHVLRPCALDGCLGCAQLGNRRLGFDFTLARQRMSSSDVAIEVADPECQQLRLQLPLELHAFLVPPRDACLALQVADLLVDFLAQVVQALEILARVRDPVLGLAPAVLVARDSRGLLDERRACLRRAPRSGARSCPAR